MKFLASRPKVTEKMLADGLLNPKVKFAIFPERMHDGSWVWFEHYIRVPIGLWLDRRFGEDTLNQFRVGGGWDDDGEYFPHRNFSMSDNRYFKIDGVSDDNVLDFLKEKSGESNVQI